MGASPRSVSKSAPTSSRHSVSASRYTTLPEAHVNGWRKVGARGWHARERVRDPLHVDFQSRAFEDLKQPWAEIVLSVVENVKHVAAVRMGVGKNGGG